MRVLTIKRDGLDGPLDAVVVDLYASVGQEELHTIPVFGDIGQSLTERGLRCDAGLLLTDPNMLGVGFLTAQALVVGVLALAEFKAANRQMADTAQKSTR